MAHPILMLLCAAGVTAAFSWKAVRAADAPAQGTQPQVFTSKVDLIKVAVVVVDRQRRFVSGLVKEDFILYDEGRRQEIESFSSDRTPVSLGILIDSTANGIGGSRWPFAKSVMTGLFDRLAPDDELFVAQFTDRPLMLQTWTTDREALQRGVDGIRGGTTDRALFDAVHRMHIVAGTGHRSRKALLIISDGNNNYGTMVEPIVRDAVRRSDVLVYAVALEDARPGARRVNTGALRGLTDSTGGRTEVVQQEAQAEDLVQRLVLELGQQYVLGFPPPPSPPLQWHDIKIEIRNRKDVTLRARGGYVSLGN